MTLRDLNARFSLGFFLYNFTIFKQNVLSIRFFLEKHFIPETCGNMENYFQGLFRYIPRDKVCVRTEDYFEHLFHKINGKLSFLVSISYNTLVERHSSSCHVFKAFFAR